jgi:predicted DCC family thiol-disulfide oxidoreductase YuxK
MRHAASSTGLAPAKLASKIDLKIWMSAASSPTGVHLILYDGLCGFCDGVTQFVLRHDDRGLFAFAPLQSATARTLLQRFDRTPDDLSTFFVVADYQSASPSLLSKAAAALFIAEALGGVWSAANALRILPQRVLDWGYDVVARNRYRWFGRLDTCRVPTAAERSRFIES